MIKTIKITDQIYIFRDSFDCYSNLIIGRDSALLFDTGCGIDNLKSAVKEVTSLPLIVLLSHGHFDHVGGSFQFDKTYISGKDRNILDGYNEALLNKWIGEMKKASPDPLCADNVINFGTDGWKHVFDLDFKEVDLGGITGEIIEMPGHSEGSIGVYLKELKLLLSGDALMPIMCLIFQNHGTPEDQLKTLEKLMGYDFEYYLTSHSDKLMPKSLLNRMKNCIIRSKGKRFHPYKYPKPPYSEGWFYLDSMDDEPVGLILETISEESMNLVKKGKLNDFKNRESFWE